MARPTKYKPDYCDLLINHMAEGLSFESFAGVLRVDRDTLYEWAKVYKKFSDAKKIGRDAGLLYWEKVGRDGLHHETIKDEDGMTVNRSINPAIWCFNMKNRFGWRDKQPDEEQPTVVNQSQFTIQPSPEQLAEIIKKARS